jgi:hypothetical protein
MPSARPDAVLARPLSLASYPVATGRPRPGHQRLDYTVGATPRTLKMPQTPQPSHPTSRVNLFSSPYAGARALTARPWSARCYGVARQREGSRQNSIGAWFSLSLGAWVPKKLARRRMVSAARCCSTGSDAATASAGPFCARLGLGSGLTKAGRRTGLFSSLSVS